MIKSELISKIAEQNKLSKNDAERVISTFFNEITKALSEGNRVELRGFGVLSVRTRKPRLARNPKTGAKVEVAEKRVPFFKAGKNINAALNKTKK
ncbi:MAG: integration host factor subunit beta [Alphaproteobacteria bacterium]|nr:integration host factor subunit beta [Alphaproteobacteria bacterium]MBR6674754.1 integration host factor subunit beta [Alphaproteobacteria bacterium]